MPASTTRIIELRPATLPPPQPAVVFIRTFAGRPDVRHSALNDTQEFLQASGFSYGPGCAASRKAGIMFGRWQIAKWRNLTPLQQHQCHGVMELGEPGIGPVTIRIFFSAPALAIAAVASPGTADAIMSIWSNRTP